MDQNFNNFNYDHLNIHQVGRIGEYWVKIWLTLLGLDVYTSEVDDKGIDFVVRLNDKKHLDIQVKTIRKANYAYIDKDSKAWAEPLKENLYFALVILKNDSMPVIYLIPANEWNHPDKFLSSRDYKGSKKSKPDWGVNITKKNMELLKQYELTKVISKIGV